MTILRRAPRWLIVWSVAAWTASAHPLHETDEQGKPITHYDPAVKPPAAGPTGSAANGVPAAAQVFAPFAPAVRTRWDDSFFYVESDGLPAHRLMVGITAWQQQVPIPQNYRGENAWRFPLRPVPAKSPLSAKTHFFRGAIAIAANGVPIFNPIKNDGRTDTFLAGELDEFGGHAGRADDYHYHVAPLHLQSAVGAGQPVAYALDGYPIYGLTCADGAAPRDLDAFNGHSTAALGYHYHATKKYPYLNGGFHGEVVEREGQVDPQPRAQGVRPATEPLRGAKITGFAQDGARTTLTYDLRGEKHTVTYAPAGDGWRFEFAGENSTPRTETYRGERRGGSDASSGARERADRAPAERRKGGRRDEAKAPDTAGKSARPAVPWILAHAKEMDADHDGRLSREEVAAEVAKTFRAYDSDGDGRVLRADLAKGAPVRSALGGFVQQHAEEIDADHDGSITAAELGQVVGRTFERAAQQGGGSVPANLEPPKAGKKDRS